MPSTVFWTEHLCYLINSGVQGIGEGYSWGWSHNPQQEERSFQAAQGSCHQEPRVHSHLLRPAHLLLCLQRVPVVRCQVLPLWWGAKNMFAYLNWLIHHKRFFTLRICQISIWPDHGSHFQSGRDWTRSRFFLPFFLHSHFIQLCFHQAAAFLEIPARLCCMFSGDKVRQKYLLSNRKTPHPPPPPPPLSQRGFSKDQLVVVLFS